MKEGAELKSPQESHIWNSDSPAHEARKEIAKEVIQLFAGKGMTYDECYKALEDTNEALMYRSRFVAL
ncbi:hypothetical protein [Desulfosporosinus youngiae]|uniref:Uncharacterized protein n=1 Tax=Desulfosporosinus youngiae DSM 17734 TaxID=768710 RepID=H5Y232_9FIRM|nr:hypothetical protein [Desulfosporosinus youngiae]EHQ88230.1 hypothetical protein DesyoDRAFT_1059 [Desulfosporosinus youngiae DSM 17734]